MFLNPITWPEGKRSAACVTFDIDADSLIRTARPEDAELRLLLQAEGFAVAASALPATQAWVDPAV
ncbi:MAG: hypothetical protein ABGX09_09705, partial [Thioclava sp.]